MARKIKDDKLLPCRIVSGLSPSEHHFCLLIAVAGYQTAKAYQLAISPSVTANSAAAMGCRLLTETRIQAYLWTLYQWRENFKFNELILKYQ